MAQDYHNSILFSKKETFHAELVFLETGWRKFRGTNNDWSFSLSKVTFETSHERHVLFKSVHTSISFSFKHIHSFFFHSGTEARFNMMAVAAVCTVKCIMNMRVASTPDQGTNNATTKYSVRQVGGSPTGWLKKQNQICGCVSMLRPSFRVSNKQNNIQIIVVGFFLLEKRTCES
jgi:hypothetical protein